MIDTTLNEHGIRQSQMLGEALAKMNITHIFCSPLQRAQQVLNLHKDSNLNMKTAIEIVKKQPDGIVIQTRHALRECHYGGLEGKFKSEMRADAAKRGMEWKTFRSHMGAEAETILIYIITNI